MEGPGSVKVILITFAGHPKNRAGPYRKRADTLTQSALKYKIADKCYIYNWQSVMDTEFGKKHKHILSSTIGAGYWLWKPYIICEALNNKLDDNDILIYHDAGRQRFDYSFKARTSPRVIETINKFSGSALDALIPYGPNMTIEEYTDSRCIYSLKGDAVRRCNMVLASFSMWKKTSRARELAEDWLDKCTLDDNIKGSKEEHRHDQSILSIVSHLRYPDALVSNITSTKSLSDANLKL